MDSKKWILKLERRLLIGMNFSGQLKELKTLPQWVAYRLVWNEKKGKADKIPVNPHDGTGAKANDSSTWGTYDEAMNYAMRQGLIAGKSGGVGFEFAGGYAGIDLDNVVLENGSLKPFAEEIVERMNSYTEYSPSGKGLHILFRLNVPLSEFGSRRRNDELGLEMYDSGRFFTVTGKIYGDVRELLERTQEARKIYDEYLAKHETKTLNTGVLTTSTGVYQESLTDNELWEKMFSSQHGREIRALYFGDMSSYGDDHSRADLALCNHLAYWTGGDIWRMDALFRQSGLMRAKWDERHGAQTYGAMTLEVALRTANVYVPYVPVSTHEVRKVGGREGVVVQTDKADKVNEDTGNLSAVVQTSEGTDKLPVRGIGKYIGSKFAGDLIEFSKYKGRKTGYANLDEKMSLYPGLYVLGAVSSLGKTTFIGQMADQLARAGDHVLYFSLEQSEFELVSKGLSRLTAQADMSEAVSSMSIREGKTTEVVLRAISEYQTFTEHEAIIECGFDTTFVTILNTVKDYVKSTGVSPVVIVDYLQIVRPSDSRMSTKDAVDEHVRAFKKLQVENNLVVILISSLNRQNYLTPIDFESFKESGGIEYTADVVWGLQLSVMNSEIFDKEKGLKAKREAVRMAKAEIPRKIELVCLKNRYGISSYKCEFLYYADCDLFIPLESEKSYETLEKPQNRRSRI